MAETGWTFNPLVAIGVGLAFMFFGYFFGLFEGRGQGYKNRQKEEAEDKKLQPVPPLPPASPPDETPILNVGMGPDGQLRLKLDGQRADTSVLDAEQRKRLIAVLTQMRPWLEAPKSTPAPAAPRTASPSQEVPSPQGTSLSDRLSQVAAAPTAQPTPPSSPAPAQKQVPAPKPAAPVPDDEDDKGKSAPQSIVAQIDAVLQARLAGTPLADRGIRLQESIDGGVLVWVGVNKFEGVDDVPDDEIKAVIRGAITQWEDKYTPGL